MMNLIKNITILVFLFTSTVLLGNTLAHSTQMKSNTSQLNHHQKDGFQNTTPNFKSDTPIIPMLWRYMTEKRKDSAPINSIPVNELSENILNQLSNEVDSVIRLGHSTIYIQVNGQKWLIDPVFSERASPFSFMGPKRFHQPPISIENLPELDGVLISHDHYDHLDKNSIKALINKTKIFIVPLSVDQHLKEWGVPEKNIKPLDWWQFVEFEGVTITATPTQHFSGRGLFDKNETLWSSYVIESPKSKVFFSGDSGYFSGFKEIGDKLGPFDLTMIETGAYDKDWPSIHMQPEESIQAHIDLQGKQLMPIHNGTFDLAFHSWYEPFIRISDLAKNNNIQLVTPIMGQIININAIEQTFKWWED